MSKRGIVPSLKDILEAIDRIQRYVGTMTLAEFLANSEKQDAVVRNLEIIGEAVRNIPPEFRKKSFRRSEGRSRNCYEVKSRTSLSSKTPRTRCRISLSPACSEHS